MTSALLALPGRGLIPMSWFKVDDSFYDHPKVFDAPDSAMALWLRAGCWAARNLTDGFVPSGMPARLCDDHDTAIRELIDRGVWQRTKGGYQFHDWGEYQPSASKVRETRAKRAEAGRKGGLAKAAGKQTASNLPEDSQENAKQISTPSRPVPSVVSVVSQLTRRYAHVLDDDDFLKGAIGLIHARHGRVLAAAEVRTMAAAILGRASSVTDPAAYVKRAIENESDPIARWLPGASEDRDTPAVPAAELHPFKPDGSGTTCEVCELPESNRHHLESA